MSRQYCQARSPRRVRHAVLFSHARMPEQTLPPPTERLHEHHPSDFMPTLRPREFEHAKGDPVGYGQAVVHMRSSTCMRIVCR